MSVNTYWVVMVAIYFQVFFEFHYLLTKYRTVFQSSPSWTFQERSPRFFWAQESQLFLVHVILLYSIEHYPFRTGFIVCGIFIFCLSTTRNPCLSFSFPGLLYRCGLDFFVSSGGAAPHATYIAQSYIISPLLTFLSPSLQLISDPVTL